MQNNRLPATARIQEVFLFILLFVMLPVIFLDGVQQPELSLKMPLLAAGLFILFLSDLIFMKKEPGRHWLADAVNTKFSEWFLVLLIWMVILVFKSLVPGDAVVELSRVVILFLFGVFITGYFKKVPGRKTFFLAGPSVTVLIVSVYGIIQLFLALHASENKGLPFIINYAIGSTLGNKNSFAEILVLCCPFMFYALLTSGKKIQWLHALAIVLAIVFLFFLKSLATWVALAAGICLFGWLQRNDLFRNFRLKISRPMIFFFAGLALAGLVFHFYFNSDSVLRKVEIVPQYIGNDQLFSKNSRNNNNSIFERLLLWRNTCNMIGENPLTGAGINNWKIFVYKYGIIGTDYISTGLVHYEHPHNDFLLILSECGIIGLFIFCMMFFRVFREGFRLQRSQEDRNRRLLATLMLCNILMFLVMSLFGYPWSKVVAVVFLLFSIGILYSLATDEKVTSKRVFSNRLGSIICLTAAALCIFIFYVGYQRLFGEAVMADVQDARYKKDWKRMQRVLDRSHSVFFEMDAVATPIEWYRGLACYYDDNPSRAKYYFLKAVKQHPYHLQALNDLGSIYEQEGNHDAALQYYSTALQVSPLNIPAILNKSSVFYNSRQADSAFVTIDRVYGNKLSGGDRKRYENAMNLILYAEAYMIIREMELTRQAGMLNQISNRRFLRKLYIDSKREDKTFKRKLQEIST